MKKLVVLLMAALCATTAMAQIDTDANQIGVYFDEGATLVEGSGPIAYAYVVLTNGTMPSVKSFDCKIWVDGDTEGMSWTRFDGPTGPNTTIAYDATLQEYAVSYLEPRPYTGTTMTLLTKLLYDMVGGQQLCFTVDAPVGNPDNPGYCTVYSEAGGDFTLCGSSANGGHSASFNGACDVVATENASFSHLKALYR